jgi:hypothetical protein
MSTQQSLEGMEAKVIPEITAKAKEFAKFRDKWIAASVPMKNSRSQLIELLHVYKLPAYFDPEEDLKVSIEPGKEKLKVKISGSLGDGEDNGEGEEEGGE